jgi:hypothetical protein
MRPPRKRDHAADRVAFANLEAGNRFLGFGGDGLLAGDLCHVAHRVLEYLLVANRLADAHVEGDLGDAGDFHDRLVAELLDQFGHHGLFVVFLQARHKFFLTLPRFRRST